MNNYTTSSKKYSRKAYQFNEIATKQSKSDQKFIVEIENK